MSTNYRGGPGYAVLRDICRKLRKTGTDAESVLWALLRNRQVRGVKFRRQHQFGYYILDFFCPSLRLAVEVDGSQHYTEQGIRDDNRRTDWLDSQGVRVVRFNNRQVLEETEGLEIIWEEVETWR
jgi:very-short-patch-repair endonuclease